MTLITDQIIQIILTTLIAMAMHCCIDKSEIKHFASQNF